MALKSRLEIANQSLMWLGESFIYDFDGISKVEGFIRTAYEQSIRSIEREHDWSFVIERRELTLLSTEDIEGTFWGFPYFKNLDDDVVRVIEAKDRGEQLSRNLLLWQVESNRLLANQETVYVRMVLSRPVDEVEATWPLYMSDLIAVKMAEILAIPITESKEREGQLLARYELERDRLITLDSSQGRAPQLRSSILTSARNQ